jgi:hypothetical protein
MQKTKKREPSKGELFIEDYLAESRIEYKEEFRINDLKEDTSEYRIADFYLPKLGFCVEYFGMYNNSKKDRERYVFKRNLYIKNRKPTIFIYPEDLGILDYVFHTEVKRLFRYKIYHNRKKYLRYSLNRYINVGNPLKIFTAFFYYIMAVIFYYTDVGELREGVGTTLGIICYFISMFYVWQFIMNFILFVNLKEIFGFVTLKNLK